MLGMEMKEDHRRKVGQEYVRRRVNVMQNEDFQVDEPLSDEVSRLCSVSGSDKSQVLAEG